MKRILLLISVIAVFTPFAGVRAADYVPLVREGVRWIYYLGEAPGPDREAYCFEFKGDEELNGVTYKRLYRYDASETLDTETMKPVALMREENGVVYKVDRKEVFWGIDYCMYVEGGVNNEQYVYDFNGTGMLKKNSSWILGSDSYKASATSKTHVETLLNGELRNAVDVCDSDGELMFTLVEGIGIVRLNEANNFFGDLLDPLGEVGISQERGLSAVYEDGVLVYKGSYYENALDVVELSGFVSLDREGVRWLYRYIPEEGKPAVAYWIEIKGEEKAGYDKCKRVYRYPGNKSLDTEAMSPSGLIFTESYYPEEVYLIPVESGRLQNESDGIYSAPTGAGSKKTYSGDMYMAYDFHRIGLYGYGYSSGMSICTSWLDGYSNVSHGDKETATLLNGDVRLMRSYRIPRIGGYTNLFSLIAGVGIVPSVECVPDLLVPFGPLNGRGERVDLAAVYEDGKLVWRNADDALYNETLALTDMSGVEGVPHEREVKGVRYYTLQGVESAQPVPGVSVRVTTYSDGTRKAEKVVR